MVFFRFRQRRAQVYSTSPRERLFRALLLLCIMLVVCWGFWQNSQRRLELLGVGNVIQDDTGRLSGAQRSVFAQKIKDIKRRYGQSVRIYVAAGDLTRAGSDTKNIVIALSPDSRQVGLSAPPLVRSALGDPFMNTLADSFYPHFLQGTWELGIGQALDMLEQKMTEVAR